MRPKNKKISPETISARLYRQDMQEILSLETISDSTKGELIRDLVHEALKARRYANVVIGKEMARRQSDPAALHERLADAVVHSVRSELARNPLLQSKEDSSYSGSKELSQLTLQLQSLIESLGMLGTESLRQQKDIIEILLRAERADVTHRAMLDAALSNTLFMRGIMWHFLVIELARSRNLSTASMMQLYGELLSKIRPGVIEETRRYSERITDEYVSRVRAALDEATNPSS